MFRRLGRRLLLPELGDGMEEDRSGLMWEAEELISSVKRGGLSGFGGFEPGGL